MTPRPWILPVLLALAWAVVLLATARRAAGEFGFPVDDAWIHARIARNLAEGGGFAFNRGDPGATSSAPLWTLLVALPASAGVPFPWAAYAAGLAAAAALAWLASRLVRRATGEAAAGTATALVAASTHPFPWSAVSGMEPTLAALLTLATALASPSRHPGRALLFASAAGLARPELVLLPAIVLADYLLRARPLRPARCAAVALAAIAAGVAPFLFNRTLTGTYVASSFAAKVGRHGIVAALLEGRTDQILPVSTSNLPVYALDTMKALATDNLWLLVLAPVGMAALARGDRGTHLPWMVCLLQPPAMAVLAPFGGAGFQEQRYIAPIVALVIAAGCAALVVLPGWSRPAGRAAWVLSALVLSVPGAWQGTVRYGIEVRNITEMQVTIGRWLAARPEGPGTVATNDIGAIGFLTGAPILDTTGLATPDVVPYLRRTAPEGSRNRGWNGANEAALLEYLAARRPRYVAIFPSWYPSPFFRQVLGEAVLRVDLEDNLICGDRTMIVYRPRWRGRDPG